ncbi:MAG: TROVE domain-containing protein, partial [Verrucomicrobiota bacterium]
AHQVKGQDWTKRFIDRVVCRADDPLEILAYYLAVYGKPLPNALKKGLGSALARFEAYQLAKYRRESASLKLVDAVNLVHPPHTEALAALMNGSLKPANTWETKLTQAGQSAESDQDKSEKKAEAWTDLVRSRKIGYFALLRNLRNILEQAPDLIDDVRQLLVDETLIRKSLVLPFRFLTALDALETSGLRNADKLMASISDAVDISLANVPRFEGRTLVAVDTSGSMSGKPIKIASLFASVLYKANDAEVILFSNSAEYATFNKRDTTLTIAKSIQDKANYGGTDFHAIFKKARAGYDRIIILSDMQAWVGYYTPAKTFAAYRKRTGDSPKVFTFDLAGYGTLQFPEKDVYALAGFSDKTMDTLRFLEEDKSALLRQIETIEL